MRNFWNEARDLLRAWADGATPPSTCTGICYNMECVRGDFEVSTGEPVPYHYRDTLREAFEAWDKFSGDPDFPVPGLFGLSSEACYDRAGNLWSDDYGMLRRDLCRHVAEWLEAHGYAE